ncbi:MAG: hypothetical protein NT157_06600 [Candidatus Micrarchaeota archaeon]|nr:hypothetical protein [Candidatus Micrarchaeota archaeon]
MTWYDPLKRMVAVVLVVMLANLAFAQMINSMNDICASIREVVPIVALLLFILAGAIYAIGQVLGSETRARATVWATAMLVGGIIGLIIAASAQFFLETFVRFSIGGDAMDFQAAIDAATCTRVVVIPPVVP